jgi:hypothetical protein
MPPPTFLCNNYWQSVCAHHVDLPHETRHLYEYREGFAPALVAHGDRVFVKTDLLDAFVACVLPMVSRPFVLLTGHSDLSPSTTAIEALHRSPLVVRWFAVNATTATHRLTPLPLGLSEPCRPIGDQAAVARAALLAASAAAAPPKADEVWFPACAPTHPVRRALEALRHPRVTRDSERRSFGAYLDRLARARYALCPRGNGCDVHRVYEAILVRTVPIYVAGDDGAVPAVYARLPVIVAAGVEGLRRVLDDLGAWGAWAERVDWGRAAARCTVAGAADAYGV